MSKEVDQNKLEEEWGGKGVGRKEAWGGGDRGKCRGEFLVSLVPLS